MLLCFSQLGCVCRGNTPLHEGRQPSFSASWGPLLLHQENRVCGQCSHRVKSSNYVRYLCNYTAWTVLSYYLLLSSRLIDLKLKGLTDRTEKWPDMDSIDRVCSRNQTKMSGTTLQSWHIKGILDTVCKKVCIQLYFFLLVNCVLWVHLNKSINCFYSWKWAIRFDWIVESLLASLLMCIYKLVW